MYHSSFCQAFTKIDLSRPWLAPYLPIHHAYQDGGDIPLADWLNQFFIQANLSPNNHVGQPLSFISQNDLPHGIAYEKFIGNTGKIPTRDNLHDWFGACIWATFPKSKAVLNHHHLQNLEDNQHHNNRNRVRDTITVFDENGAILVVSDDTIGDTIASALTCFDWQTCLVKHRPYWHHPSHPSTQDKAQLLVFGHALLEQLITPRKPLCSHTILIGVPSDFFGLPLVDKLVFIDTLLSAKLDHFLQQAITPKHLHPLPILGVPYFWDNTDPAFYEDAFVFRCGRRT